MNVSTFVIRVFKQVDSVLDRVDVRCRGEELNDGLELVRVQCDHIHVAVHDHYKD
jgi:hypothetical protein